MEKSVFFGNGLNRLNPDNPEWTAVLNYLKASRPFDSNMLPNTLIYDRIILEKHLPNLDFLGIENDIKKELAKQFTRIYPVQIYIDLYELPASNYLTTNYDDVFIHSLEATYDFKVKNNSTEDLYSVRRQKEIISKMRKTQLWQLHGSIDKPASIMLGLDHYCGSIGKLDSYVKGTYEYTQQQNKVQELSISDKILNDRFSGSSWVELFFNSDIHMLGYSLDYVETDIWWIIDRRARMRKYRELEGMITNKIFFYCSEIEQQKKQLLESFDVIVDVIPLDDRSATKFADHYATSIQRIRTR